MRKSWKSKQEEKGAKCFDLLLRSKVTFFPSFFGKKISSFFHIFCFSCLCKKIANFALFSSRSLYHSLFRWAEIEVWLRPFDEVSKITHTKIWRQFFCIFELLQVKIMLSLLRLFKFFFLNHFSIFVFTSWC